MNGGGFVKLYASVITSSVWAESPITKLAWLTLLIIADADGRIEGTVPGVARLIGISVQEFEEALAVFKAPDLYSRSKTDDGRRLREIDGGWQLVSYAAYREKRSQKQVRQADWLAAKRASAQSSPESTRVDMSTNDDPVDAQMSEDRDQKENISSSSPGSPDPRAHFDASEADAEPKDGRKAPAKKPRAKPEADQDVRAVFVHWQTKLHPRAVLDAPRAKAVKRQLDAGRTVADLIRAVDGCAGSAWHVENRQTDLELICRDAKHVESFLAKADGARPSNGESPPFTPNARNPPPAGRTVAEALRNFR